MGLTVGERLKKWIFQAVTGVLYMLFRLLSRQRHDGALKLSPIRNPLLKLSAVQLAEKIRKREVSSVEVVQAFIDRIQEVNPLLNAMVNDRFSSALSEAAHVDQLIEEHTGGEEVLQEQLPLLGVPLSVKGSFFLQGMPCSVGMISRAGVISSEDAPHVALLKRAGAIPLGVTNTSELCMWMETSNHLHGITNNPYDIGRTSGGSSGGEGSIVSSGGSVIGIGSDIGGSIRMPCFFNGIFGHKPTPGIISNVGQHPAVSGLHDEFLSAGPLCRYAEDLLLMTRVMAGANADKLSLSLEVDLKKLRFFTVVDDGGSPLTSPVDKQLMRAQRKVVRQLEEDLGVRVKDISFPQLKYSYQIFDTFLALPDKDGKPPQSFVELMSDGGPGAWPLWELIKWLFGKCDHTLPTIGWALLVSTCSATPSQFILQQKETLQREMDEVLGTDGVLLYPSHPLLAPRHHHPIFTPFNFSYTGIFNILGLPVSQCPLGLNEEGLPLGVQVVAGRLQDHLTLAMARYLERAFGGWREPAAEAAGAHNLSQTQHHEKS
ncbi:fatty-acid amide hydrolase 2-B isoform X2 [Electrophorus electricus]|uniref:Amidase domain-containing protein n=1 Tax=Electrophorus electricus TaxID=8005 RepID=A0A4W4EJ87_ELEEL|nr:fatty-acid amide hydrolase 2-B isoform X2 [Electrophorus electricus]